MTKSALEQNQVKEVVTENNTYTLFQNTSRLENCNLPEKRNISRQIFFSIWTF
jgi:hypothetical protein